nr:hypothetical protein [Tanacetum cinerariifolium]
MSSPRLLYDNSSPHPPEEFVSKNSDAAIESFSPPPIPVEDNDSLMEEIDLSFNPSYPMPSGIEDDDYDSERDILILKELLSNDSLSLSENESFHFDIPLFFRPPVKPPDGCALLRKKFMEDLFTSGIEHGILKDSSEPSNDNPNAANAPQDLFVVNQDPDKNSSQRPLQINHHCCYGCGDPLEGIFSHQCTCKFYGNGAHYGYNFLLKVPIIPDLEPFNNQTIKDLPPTVQSFDPKANLVHDSPNVFNPPPQLPFYSYEFHRNDARYGHYCTP